jgi:hypothetical protein
VKTALCLALGFLLVLPTPGRPKTAQRAGSDPADWRETTRKVGLCDVDAEALERDGLLIGRETY